jgi:streptogramin lyase
MRARFLCLATAVAVLTACGGNQSPSALVPSAAIPAATTRTGTLMIRVRRPLHPDVISPSTKGMTVKIDGPTKFRKTVGLVINASGCRSSLMTLECTLQIPGLKNCPTKKRCYTASVATYDAFDAARNRIPKGSHLLSQVQGLSFAISSASTLIPLVLEGVPATVAFIPAANTLLTGTQNTGYVEPKCSASSQTVTALGVDADGNFILGPGSPGIGLSSDNPAQLSVSKISSNTFALNPPVAPAYAYGNQTTHVTVSAKPGSKSGGTTRTAVVAVSYSGDICGVISEFAVPTAASQPANITRGPDGNLWFTEFTGSRIGRISTLGAITEFPLPAASQPFGIAAGPDGNLWFTETGPSMIGAMNVSGAFVTTPTATAGSTPYTITAGADGNMWFTEFSNNAIGVISPATKLTKDYPLVSGAHPAGIVAGPNGNLWFVESGTGKVGMVTPLGAVSEYSIPSGGSSSPLGIAVAADSNLWFTECSKNDIGRVSTTGVVLPQYPLPETSSEPTFITLGPDGRVWFTEQTGNRVGAIGSDGTITEVGSPTSGSNPVGIVTGPDGAIWFTELVGNKIARLR